MHILIVDDEPLVRSYIRSLLEKAGDEPCICTEAASADEALFQMSLKEPDIALLDVHMPGMDGVQLVQAIQQTYPYVACIMLSGHDDFAYVHDAMTHGAQEYLLKHRVTQAVLRDAVAGALSKRQSRLQEEDQAAQLKRQAYAAVPILRERLLRALLMGHEPPEGAASTWQGMMADFPGGARLLVLEISKTDMKAEAKKRIHQLHERVQYVVQEAIGTKSPVLPAEDNRYATLVRAMEDDRRMAAKACSALQLFLNLRAAAACSEPVDAMAHCAHRYSQAVRVLTTARPVARLSIAHTEQLLGALASGNELYLQMACAQVLRHYGGAGLQEWEKITEEIFAFLWVFLEQEELDGDTVLYPYVQKLRQSQCPQSIPSILTALMIAVQKTMDGKQRPQCHSRHIEQAIAYIRANYAQPVTLESVAASVSVSPAYLSRLFREECGITFTEYVNQFRVDLAGRYLRRGKSAKEAAELVGFVNQSYFFRVFKSIKHCTPTEYVKA